MNRYDNMNILLSIDSFKDCLTSKQAGDELLKGLKKYSNDFNIKNIPIADGGEGTVYSLVEATKGKLCSVQVKDPLMRNVKADYGISGDKSTAFIEMAAASGIELLKREERNPWNTTTFGTGELILDALNRGCRRFIIGIGGSATNDGGIGMATAIGARFINNNGEKILTGGELQDLSSIDLSALDERVSESEFIVACDVSNPLTGRNGASYVYASQKGAYGAMVRNLDLNLIRLAEIIFRDTGIEVDKIPGSGAAGGLGGGLMAFLGATLKNGFEIVRNEIDLDKYCRWADVVITGEGKLDNQTKFGKAPFGVMNCAKKYNKPVFAIAGLLGDGYMELFDEGFDGIYPISEKTLPLEESIIRAPELIKNLGEKLGQILKERFK